MPRVNAIKGPDDFNRGFSPSETAARGLAIGSKFVPQVAEYRKSIKDNRNFNQEEFNDYSNLINNFMSDERIINGIKENGNFNSTDDVKKAFAIDKMQPKKNESNKKYAQRIKSAYQVLNQATMGFLQEGELIDMANQIGSGAIPGQTKAFRNREQAANDQSKMKSFLETPQNPDQIAQFKAENPDLAKKYSESVDYVEGKANEFVEQSKARDTEAKQNEILLVAESPSGSYSEVIDTMMKIAGTDRKLQVFAKDIANAREKSIKFTAGMGKKDAEAQAKAAKAATESDAEALAFTSKNYNKEIKDLGTDIKEMNTELSELDPKSQADQVAVLKGEIKNTNQQLTTVVSELDEVNRYISSGTVPDERFPIAADLLEPVREMQNEEIVNDVREAVEGGIDAKPGLLGIFRSGSDEDKAQAVASQYGITVDGNVLIGRDNEIIGKIEKGKFVEFPSAKEEQVGLTEQPVQQSIQQQAPAPALEYLQQNPDAIDAFEEKYGYRPEGL